jgi:hypothetical protein
MIVATYLANKPAGAPQVYLIVATTLLAVAAIFAAWSRDVYRAAIAAGWALFALALLTH